MSALPAVQDIFGTSRPLGKHFDVTLETECEIEGRLVCRGPSSISGKIVGSIDAEDTLIIEEGAVVEANISGTAISIKGKVTGKITATKEVFLSATAVFIGEIHSPRIEMEEGARFDGTSRMTSVIREADGEVDEAVTSPVHLIHESLSETMAS